MIIGVTGHARNGKDSVANMLVADYGFTKLGFADGVRQLALAIDPFVNIERDTHFTEGNTPFARYSQVLKQRGYEEAKSYADVRRLLQRIGTEAVRELFGADAWVNLMAQRVYELRAAAGDPSTGLPDVDVVISDVRFENEANYIKSVGGVVVRVIRPGYEGSDAHASERGVEAIGADITLTAVDLTELRVRVEDMMDITLPALLAGREADYYTKLPSSFTEPRATRVYLAAPWAQKAEAGVAKLQLIAAGLDVVSGWTERENTPAEIDPARMREQAELDRDEVNVADALVILGLSKSEGKATEMGMALAQGKRVILVKPDCVGNIFYNLPSVQRVDTLDEAIGLLVGLPVAVPEAGYKVEVFSIHDLTPNKQARIVPSGVDSAKGDYAMNTTGLSIAEVMEASKVSVVSGIVSTERLDADLPLGGEHDEVLAAIAQESTGDDPTEG